MVRHCLRVCSKEKVVLVGGAVGVYAAVSALVTSLAGHGVRVWRRALVVPWLCFYLGVLCLLVLHLADSLYLQQLQWRHGLLFLASFAILSCWRHMLSQHRIMAQPRPQVDRSNITKFIQIIAAVRGGCRVDGAGAGLGPGRGGGRGGGQPAPVRGAGGGGAAPLHRGRPPDELGTSWDILAPRA